jgi:hypothetical protein
MAPVRVVPNEPDDEPSGEESRIDPYAPETHTVAGPDVPVEKHLTRVKVLRPRKDEYFRIHPSPAYVHDYQLLVVDDGMEKEQYLVLPGVRHLVEADMRPHRLFVGINRHDAVFIWPVKLPTGSNDGGNSWSESALMCTEEAKTAWIKIRGNRGSGSYDVTRAIGQLEDPKWPQKSFRDLVELAFNGKVVDSPDHPVILKLSGSK